MRRGDASTTSPLLFSTGPQDSQPLGGYLPGLVEFYRTSRSLQKQRSKETVCVLRGSWTRNTEETDSDNWNFEEKKKDEMRVFKKMIQSKPR